MASNWATRDLPRPCAFIQWKGTEVCGDYYCLCGEQFHIDDMFVYGVICPHCERRYEVSSMIELRELAADEEWDGCELKTEAPAPQDRVGQVTEIKIFDPGLLAEIYDDNDTVLDASEVE